jgi:hypothetical protein
MITGYVHPDYAASLAEFGTPRELPHCQGWILEREIPGFPDRDAMGCYPLFACEDWSQLHRDLDEVGDGLVSLALVTDPFGDYDAVYLRRCFDRVIPFKEHFVAELSRPPAEIISRHHRRYVRKALENVRVETCQEPTQHIDEWSALWGALADRANIRGLRAYSRRSFLKQLTIPGLVMFRALQQNTAIGAAICFVQEEVVYGHLMGISEVGHELGVSYALYWAILQYFSGKVRWIDWGGTPGVQNDSTLGMSHFKRGWSTATRTTYFCGRIYDRGRYLELAEAKGISNTDYFPAYRKDEFA